MSIPTFFQFPDLIIWVRQPFKIRVGFTNHVIIRDESKVILFRRDISSGLETRKSPENMVNAKAIRTATNGIKLRRTFFANCCRFFLKNIDKSVQYDWIICSVGRVLFSIVHPCWSIKQPWASLEPIRWPLTRISLSSALIRFNKLSIYSEAPQEWHHTHCRQSFDTLTLRV